MRSIPAGTFERLSSIPSLWQAWKSYRQGKRRLAAVASFDLDADQYLLGLHAALRAGSWQPGPWTTRIVHDPKKRLIAAPAVLDRVLHLALLNELTPTLQRSFIQHSYAAMRGRGPQRAALYALACTRRFGFRCQLDIRQYFPSVHLPTLHGLYAKHLRDRRTRDLLGLLLNAGRAVYDTSEARAILCGPLEPDRGLPLGSSLSQWSGSFYLNGMDHYVQRKLRPRAYLRYMDDFVLFHDDRQALHAMRASVRNWLASERSLSLNPKHGAIIPCDQPTRFLGYRICPAGLRPSRKLRRRMHSRIRLAAREGPESLRRTVRAYRGLLSFP